MGSVATFGTATAAQGSDEKGEGGRAASPTPSNASVRTTASLQRVRRQQASESPPGPSQPSRRPQLLLPSMPMVNL